MNTFKKKISAAIFVLAVIAGSPIDASAITRTKVMIRARAFAYHPWRCTTANLTAGCDPGYSSVYIPGDYMGLPYDWGGYVSLFEFDQHILNGYGAGSYSGDGVLTCTTGLDCSGYVSQAWDTPWKYGTWTIGDISHVIALQDVLPGDAFNIAGYHIILYSHTLSNGDPVFYEVIGYNTQINVTGGWAHVAGYTPIRYNQIQGTSADIPLGSPDNPIKIESFPYTDSRDTSQSQSNVLDACGLAPHTDQSGPEYIYEVNFTQPGILTVSVSDDIGVDIDVHLYASMNSNDCLARHDTHFSVPVDCSTYYVVADTYVGSSGTVFAGPYVLNVDFTPSGGPCGSHPGEYDFEGKPGAPCAYPGNENLPFCNPNLGSTVCLYNGDMSFCSMECNTTEECGDIPGGCCENIGSNQYYCLVESLCPSASPDGGVPDGQTPHDGGPTDDAFVSWDDGGGDGGIPQQDGSIQDAGKDEEPTGSSSSGCSCTAAGRNSPKNGTPIHGPSLMLIAIGVGLNRRRKNNLKKPVKV